MGISFAGLSGGGGKVQKVDTITSTQSWTAPDDVTHVDLLICGGGGSGRKGASNNTAPAGGAGSVEEFFNVPVTPSSTYTVTIGAGGSVPGDGSSSSFGNLVSVIGGQATQDSGALLYNYRAGRGGFGGRWSNGEDTLSGKGYKGLGGGGSGPAMVPLDGGGLANFSNSINPRINSGAGGASHRESGGTPTSGASGVCYISYWTAG